MMITFCKPCNGSSGVPSSVLEALQDAARSLGIRRQPLLEVRFAISCCISAPAVPFQVFQIWTGWWREMPLRLWRNSVVRSDHNASALFRSMGLSAQWRFGWMGSRWIWQQRGRSITQPRQRIQWCGREPFRLTLRAGTSRSMPWPLIWCLMS